MVICRSRFLDEDDLLLLYDVEYDHLLADFQLPGRAGRTILGAPCAPDEPLADGWTRRFGRRFNVSDWTSVACCKIVYVSTGAGDGGKMMNFMFRERNLLFYLSFVTHHSLHLLHPLLFLPFRKEKSNIFHSCKSSKDLLLS